MLKYYELLLCNNFHVPSFPKKIYTAAFNYSSFKREFFSYQKIHDEIAL